jgi:hypothetical protein
VSCVANESAANPAVRGGDSPVAVAAVGKTGGNTAFLSRCSQRRGGIAGSRSGRARRIHFPARTVYPLGHFWTQAVVINLVPSPKAYS